MDLHMIICLTAGVDLSDETHDSRRNFDKMSENETLHIPSVEMNTNWFASMHISSYAPVRYVPLNLELRLVVLLLICNLYLGFFYIKAIWNSLNSWNPNSMFVVTFHVWIDRIWKDVLLSTTLITLLSLPVLLNDLV